MQGYGALDPARKPLEQDLMNSSLKGRGPAPSYEWQRRAEYRVGPGHSEGRGWPIKAAQQRAKEAAEGRHYSGDRGVDVRPKGNVAQAQPPLLTAIKGWR